MNTTLLTHCSRLRNAESLKDVGVEAAFKAQFFIWNNIQIDCYHSAVIDWIKLEFDLLFRLELDLYLPDGHLPDGQVPLRP